MGCISHHVAATPATILFNRMELVVVMRLIREEEEKEEEIEIENKTTTTFDL